MQFRSVCFYETLLGTRTWVCQWGHQIALFLRFLHRATEQVTVVYTPMLEFILEHVKNTCLKKSNKYDIPKSIFSSSLINERGRIWSHVVLDVHVD